MKLSENITVISTALFRWCSSLETIEIPEGVKTINSEAFKGCTNLRIVELPSTLTQIDYDAFQNTSNIEEVYVKKEKGTIDFTNTGIKEKDVLYLGRFVEINYEVSRKDGNNFIIYVSYNGHKEILTKIEATGRQDYIPNNTIFYDENYEYNIKDLRTLQDNSYEFYASGEFKNNPQHLRRFGVSTNITGFVNYIDENGNHLNIRADLKHYEKGEKINLTKEIPNGTGTFVGWATYPNASIDDVVTDVYMNDTNINLYPVYQPVVSATINLDYNYPQGQSKVVTENTYIGAKYKLPTVAEDNNLTIEGYTFKGWSL